MSKAALLGSPIQHSLSPRLFKLFAEQKGRVLDYQAFEVKPAELSSALKSFQQQGYQGLNLTLPLKEQAFGLVHESSLSAKKAVAINVITFQEDGRMFGENTDGLGFVRDLTQRKKVSLTDKSILILGAGGAVRGLMAALLKERPRQVVIANRTLAKAEAIARAFHDKKNPVISSSWTDIGAATYDLVIQGTSAALQGELLALPTGLLNRGACCYDLTYGKSAESFVAWAQAQGALAYDGLGMLVEQAAETYYLWTGERVDTGGNNLITP